MIDKFNDDQVADIAAAALAVLAGIQDDRLFDDRYVAEAVRMLRSGFTLPEVHENWCDQRREQGWVYGARFSLRSKKDPRLVKWWDSPSVRRQGEVLRGIVVALSV